MKDPLETETVVESRNATTGFVALAVAVGIAIALRPSIWVTVALIVGIALTIMLHEFGHYVMAKRAGMKVTEFFLGFGPRIWSFRKGETEYGIKAIPAGGYVRIVGMSNVEEIDPEDEPRTYRASTYGKKMSVVLAGITMNIMIFVVLVFIALVLRGQDELSTKVDVLPKTPAAVAGLRDGDKIVAVDGVAIESWEDLGAAVRPNAGKTLDVAVVRDGATYSYEMTPAEVDGQARIGVSAKIVTERLSVPEAAVQSFVYLGRGTEKTGEALGQIFSPSGVERYGRTVANPDGTNGFSDAERPRSVIGIVAEGGSFVGGDVFALLALLASINLFLALFNLIPLLPFDGGHAAVATYEAIASKVTRRRVVVDFRRLMPITAAVVVLILMLGLSAMYLDVRQIVTK